MFQSTHPRRVWRKRLLCKVLKTKFQSTHPRRVWQAKLDEDQYHLLFQSTHPRRVWLLMSSSTDESFRFNPHTHEGCDSRYPKYNWDAIVSIHTPTKGVTLLPSTCAGASVFQSTHPRRVWPLIPIPSSFTKTFQSTHPRRVWRFESEVIATYFGFNPHTHEGCDNLFAL